MANAPSTRARGGGDADASVLLQSLSIVTANQTIAFTLIALRDSPVANPGWKAKNPPEICGGFRKERLWLPRSRIPPARGRAHDGAHQPANGIRRRAVECDRRMRHGGIQGHGAQKLPHELTGVKWLGALVVGVN